MIALQRSLYHPVTGIEITSDDCLEFDIQEDSAIGSLLRDKDLLLEATRQMQAEIHTLTKVNSSLQNKLSQAETENEKLKKSKAIADALGLRRKQFAALRRIIKAEQFNEDYARRSRDIELVQKI